MLNDNQNPKPMSDKHTPEKMNYYYCEPDHELYIGSSVVAQVNTEETGKRIAASWNFCAGATNEELEGSSYAELKNGSFWGRAASRQKDEINQLTAERDKIKAQRDELVVALSGLMPGINHATYLKLCEIYSRIKDSIEPERNQTDETPPKPTHIHIPRPSPTAKPKKVVPPEGCKDWLTPGKIYHAFDCTSEISDFDLVDDLGRTINCVLISSFHLNGQNWIVIEWEE